MHGARIEMSETRESGRLPLYESRLPGRNFAVYLPENSATIYADGLAGVLGGGPITKLDFFVTTEARSDPEPTLGMRETREVCLRLTIPTGQLVESILNLIQQLGSNIDALVQANAETSQNFAQNIERLRELNLRRSDVV
jgi:hypothetical protein